MVIWFEGFDSRPGGGAAGGGGRGEVVQQYDAGASTKQFKV